MRFMSFYKPGQDLGGSPSEREMAELGALIDEMQRAGVLVETNGLLPADTGAQVRFADGAFTVTDGPFTETKDVIGGYAILDVASRDEAIAHTKRFLSVMRHGECEVRQMFEAGSSDCPGQVAHQQAAGEAPEPYGNA